MNMPYVVGSNPNSPTNPHDAKSSGGNDIGSIDTSPVNSTHVLYGAVVGGPNSKDNFWNIRSDWPETEVRRGFLSTQTRGARLQLTYLSGRP